MNRPCAAMLEVSGVSRRFGGIQAVDDVSIAVPPGVVFGLIGPNGAGKTTLVNMVTGHERCDSGTIRLADEQLTGRSVHAIARLGVARTFQNIRLYRDLSALDNVIIGGHRHRPSDALGAVLPSRRRRRERSDRIERARELLRLTGLDPDAVASRLAGTLAYGDQRRVEIARALAADPRLLILDEPAAGMNRNEKDRLRDLIAALVDGGARTLLLIEHDVRLVREACDRVAVLDFGAKLTEGTPDEVVAHPDVIAAYLGVRGGEQSDPGRAAHAAAAAPEADPATRAASAAAQGDRPIRAGGRQAATRPLLEVEDLHVSYGAIRAVQGVSFDVRDGELVTLIGANGAGKSSILRALSGIVPATGRARYGNVDLLRARSSSIVAAGLVHVPEGREILGRLTVLENLMLGGWVRTDKAAVAGDVAGFLEQFPILGQRRDLPAGQLSGGEQQLLAVARALVARPRLLVLDEPSLGLAPVLADEVFDIVRAINADGIAVLLVEQNAYRALELADRAWVVETGRIALGGTGAELLHDERVRATYLGL